jgi:hypothetical protein
MNKFVKLSSNEDDIKYCKIESELSYHEKLNDAIDFLKRKDCINDKIYKKLTNEFVNDYVINLLKKNDKKKVINLLIKEDIKNITANHVEKLIKKIIEIMLIVMKKYDSIAKQQKHLHNNNKKLIDQANHKMLNFHSVNSTLLKLKSNIIFQNIEINKKKRDLSYGITVKLIEDFSYPDFEIRLNKDDELNVIDIDMLENMLGTFFVIDKNSINSKFGKTTLISVLKTNINPNNLKTFKNYKMKEYYNDLLSEILWLKDNNIGINNFELELYEKDYIKTHEKILTFNFYNFLIKYKEDCIRLKFLEDQNIFNEEDFHKIKSYFLINDNNKKNNRLVNLLNKITENSTKNKITYMGRFKKIFYKVNDNIKLNFTEKQFFINIMRMKCFDFIAKNILIEIFCNDILERVEYLDAKEIIYDKAISDINEKDIITDVVKEEKEEKAIKELKKKLEKEKEKNNKLKILNKEQSKLIIKNNNQIKLNNKEIKNLKVDNENFSKIKNKYFREIKELKKKNYKFCNLNKELIEESEKNLKILNIKDEEILRKDNELNKFICKSLLYDIINKIIIHEKDNNIFNIKEQKNEIYNISETEEKLNDSNKNENREWMFINRFNCMFEEAFTKTEIINFYISDKIWLNTPVRNINWERNTGYTSLMSTELYYELPKIIRDENIYFE